MNASDISLLVLAVIPVAYRGWMGARHGASSEIRFLLATFFGVLVALRYWQPVAETLTGAVTFDPRWVTIAAFVAVFALAGLVAGLVVNLKAKVYQSVKPNIADNVLGLLAGIFTGALLGASLLGLSMVAVPGKFGGMPEVQKFVDFPRAIFQEIETVMGVAPDSAARTRHPEVSLVDTPAPGGSAPAGMVLMQQRGRVAWK